MKANTTGSLAVSSGQPLPTTAFLLGKRFFCLVLGFNHLYPFAPQKAADRLCGAARPPRGRGSSTSCAGRLVLRWRRHQTDTIIALFWVVLLNKSVAGTAIHGFLRG